MPAKTTILPLHNFTNPTELADVLDLLVSHKRISRSQFASILMLCSGAYPFNLEIAQRTPKEMLYVSVNNARYTINNRAKIITLS